MRLSTALVSAFASLAALGSASAQYMCFDDVNGDGDVDGILESAACPSATHCPLNEVACDPGTPGSPAYVCPDPDEIANACTTSGGFCAYEIELSPGEPDIERRACVEDPDAVPPTPATCPLGDAYACLSDGSGGQVCSDTPCQDMGGAGGFTETERPREAYTDDGARNPDGSCADMVLFFSGYALDCRPVGLGTLFQNCCDTNKPPALTDNGGASGTTYVGAVGVVATGMRAAFTASEGGATPDAAAEAGRMQIETSYGPDAVTDLSFVQSLGSMIGLGCKAPDVETAVLRESGMCHYVGDYCGTDTIFGCVQKKRAHCCFDSMLGRIIHQQGRPQIARFASLPNLGWGEPETPECSGFTPTEFQALDFGSMDLSEYYNRLQTRSQTQMNVMMQGEADEYVATNGVD